MISLDNCPPSFKDIQIAEAPSVYEAYLYIFTILSGEHKDKKYAGIHKGYVGDGYWNSSTDKTFNQLITLFGRTDNNKITDSILSITRSNNYSLKYNIKMTT